MKLLVFLGSLSLASAVCNYGTSHNPRVQRRAEATFGYSDLTGPLDWHGLAAENSACALGISQSPIDINPAELTTVSGFNLAFNVASNIEGAEIENLGTTLEVFVNGTIQLGYKAYELAQFHIHTPSEHHILGEYYPAETHFVFEAADASIAVVGFVIEVAGAADVPSPLLSSVFQNVEEITEPGSTALTAGLNFDTLISHIAGSDVSQYSGSLTTPPCSEQVSWNVVNDPLFIDVETYRRVKTIVGFNARYSQNILGNVNLLDNARNVLDTGAEL